MKVSGLLRCTVAAMAALFATALPAASGQPEQEVVVYSARNEQLIKPLFDAYEKASGVRIRFLTDKEGPLMARLKAEGANTPADLLLTVDAGNLWQAAEAGLLQPLNSPLIAERVPAHLRGPGGLWTGLSVRARTLVYNPTRVDPAELSTYAALAEPQWRGRLCLRTSNKVYNQSLVAMLIAEHGEAEAERIVRGWVANLATSPFADDTAALKAVAAGQCDLTLVNTYYLGRLLAEDAELPLKIFWPNQQQADSGVHVNISGGGITRHAKHADAARGLLEWLTSAEAQAAFAGENLEYPAVPEVAVAPLVAAWGEFRQSPLNVASAGARQAAAVRLMDRAGYR